MAVLSPELAAETALVAHLTTHAKVGALTGVEVVRGWPDNRDRLPTTNVVVAVVVGDVALAPTRPRRVASLDKGDGTHDIYYAVAAWTADVQVEIWSRNKTHRDELIPGLQSALVNAEIPCRTLLRLDMPDYYNLGAVYSLTGILRDDEDQPSGEMGSWRASITMQAAADAVEVKNTPVLAAAATVVVSVTTV